MGRRIEKFRLVKSYEPIPELNVEFDVFIDGRDLVLGEIEVPSLETLKLLKPLGEDVSEEPKYKNKNLAHFWS